MNNKINKLKEITKGIYMEDYRVHEIEILDSLIQGFTPSQVVNYLDGCEIKKDTKYIYFEPRKNALGYNIILMNQADHDAFFIINEKNILNEYNNFIERVKEDNQVIDSGMLSDEFLSIFEQSHLKGDTFILDQNGLNNLKDIEKWILDIVLEDKGGIIK